MRVRIVHIGAVRVFDIAPAVTEASKLINISFSELINDKPAAYCFFRPLIRTEINSPIRYITLELRLN